MTQHATYCRICESLCGLVVDVTDGQIERIRPDPDHPISAGFACPKGPAMIQVQNDPERIERPLRRRADGSLEPVSWDVALKEIGARLNTIRAAHGNDAIGLYMGNPGAFSPGHFMWVKGMVDGLGTPHLYSSASQDTNSRFAASALLYGSPLSVPVPDIPNTDLLLIVGANPLISHGSLIAGGLIREDLKDVVARGGRVVVVDPRRTETARTYEHVPVLPDSDAWLLLALLQVIFAEDLVGRAVFTPTRGVERLRELAREFTPDATQPRTGVPPEVVRALARDLARAPSAAVYGRTGACLGKSSTLVNFLLDALNVVTGNLDRRGGVVFPAPPIDLVSTAIKRGLDTYGSTRSRVGGFPDVLGMMPAGIMADEIRQPGAGQLRALVVTAGNPLLSVPDSVGLDSAFAELDLMVGIDFYVNETHRHADYILPATTFLEREDFNLFVLPYQYRTFVQWTDPVVAPRGEAREEWQILRDLCAELGIVPSSAKAVRRLGRLGRRASPRFLLDTMLRTGKAGDRFGLRSRGLSRRRLRGQPHGILLAEAVPTGNLNARVTHEDGRIDMAPQVIADEIERLERRAGPTEDFPLLLFGRRELRSINSWMHNSAKLNPKQLAPPLQMHPADAESLGLGDGETVEITSSTGAVQVELSVTDDVTRGSVSLPHAWGHDGTGHWTRANATGGANYNTLSAAGPDALEPLAAMAVLNGVPVRVTGEGLRGHGHPKPHMG